MRSLLNVAAATLTFSVGVQATAYDPTDGLNFAYLSAAAYCNQAPVQGWSCAACTQGGISLQNLQWMEDDTLSNYGYVGADSDGNVYVSYRGTADAEVGFTVL